MLELKRFEEALESYDRALAHAPDNISALVGRGHALRELNRNDEALIGYDRVLVLDPANLDAMENKIKVLIALDRHADVLVVLRDRAAACAGPHRYRQYAQCGASASGTLRRSARRRAKRALSLDANNGAAHFNLGNALYSLGQYEEAEASFRQVDRAGAGHRGAPTKISAATLLALEQFDNALNSFDRAVELGPQSDDTQTNRSLVYLGLGDFKRGWTDYQHRFETRPEE